MHKPLDEFFGRHMKIALQFSAGKDAAATLYLLEPYWDRMVVVWGNGGDPYPETREYMDKIKSMVPHFVEICGNQQEWVKQYGHPTDVLPVSGSPFGPFDLGREAVKFQPFSSCCEANIWGPVMSWCWQNEITGIIRGQKRCDNPKSKIKHKEIVNRFEFFYPLDDWTDDQVREFLGDKIPDSYKRGLISSLDCMSCTAYIEKNVGRVADLQLIHPTAAEEIRRVHKALLEETMAVFDLMENTENGNQ